MAINTINSLPGSQPSRAEGAQVQVGRNEPSAPQEQTGKPSAVDTVSLTDTASRLRNLENTLAELPVVDSQRVESVRNALANGTYEINPERIAAKLIEAERESSR